MNIAKKGLNLLEVFIAIYEEEKLTLVADRLGLTQPALKRMHKQGQALRVISMALLDENNIKLSYMRVQRVLKGQNR